MATELWELGWNINKKREEKRNNNIMNFTSEELTEYRNQYNKIVQKGIQQNSETKSKYLRDKEKAVAFEGLKDYCNIRTIISTCIKQGICYFETIKNIIINKKIIVNKAGLIMMP